MHNSYDTRTNLETIYRKAPRSTLVAIWIRVRKDGGSLLLHSADVRILNCDGWVWYHFVIARILPDVTGIERLGEIKV